MSGYSTFKLIREIDWRNPPQKRSSYMVCFYISMFQGLFLAFKFEEPSRPTTSTFNRTLIHRLASKVPSQSESLPLLGAV